MANPASIKTKIMQRFLDLFTPMIGSTTFRVVARKRALFLTEQQKPALHIVSGDETVVDQDNRGYRCKFPLALQVIFDAEGDAYGAADKYEALIQAKIEADEQLLDEDGSALVSKIEYEGASPFVTEEKQPSNMVILMYQIEYRRERALPHVSY